MENYTLYFKLLNHPEQFKKVTNIQIDQETISVSELLNIANSKLKNIIVTLCLKATDSETDEVIRKNLQFNLKKVETWLYLNNCETYIGIPQLNTGNLFPGKIDGFVMLKKED